MVGFYFGKGLKSAEVSPPGLRLALLGFRIHPSTCFKASTLNQHKGFKTPPTPRLRDIIP